MLHNIILFCCHCNNYSTNITLLVCYQFYLYPFKVQYLFAYSSSTTAFGLLVGLGQGSVTGTQAFTGGVIHFSASTLHVAVGEARDGMRQFFITQK